MKTTTLTSQVIEIAPEEVLVNNITDRFDDLESIELSFIEGKNKVVVILNKNLFNMFRNDLKHIEF